MVLFQTMTTNLTGVEYRPKISLDYSPNSFSFTPNCLNISDSYNTYTPKLIKNDRRFCTVCSALHRRNTTIEKRQTDTRRPKNGS